MSDSPEGLFAYARRLLGTRRGRGGLLRGLVVLERRAEPALRHLEREFLVAPVAPHDERHLGLELQVRDHRARPRIPYPQAVDGDDDIVLTEAEPAGSREDE